MHKWVITAISSRSTLPGNPAQVKIKYTPFDGIELSYDFLTEDQFKCLQAALSFAQIDKPFRAMFLLNGAFSRISKMDITPIEEEKQEA